MAKFYGQVEGSAQTIATRRGSDHIRSSVQSWNGSVITSLRYDNQGALVVQIGIANNSSMCADDPIYFFGTLEDLKECFRDWHERSVEELKGEE